MTFSAELKAELIEHENKTAEEKEAELLGFLYTSGRVKSGIIEVRKGGALPLKKYFTSICQTFKITPGKAKSSAASAPAKAAKILKIPEDAVSEKLNEFKLTSKTNSCKRAFLRGAFIASGTIADPAKGYHLEIAARALNQAEFIRDVMSDFALSGKIGKRGERVTLYLKDADAISSMIALLEGNVSMMRFENARILHEMAGSTNRRTNCETANIYKTVSASIKQIADIELLDKKIGLRHLEPKLREAAIARVNNPDASLSELGELMRPPIGRSGINHRLRKIAEMAENYRRTAND